MAGKRADPDPYLAAGATPLSPSTIRGSGFETAREKDRAALQREYLGQALTALQLDRLRNTPPPPPPKTGAQNALEAMQQARASALAKAAAAKEFNLPSLEQNARNAYKSAEGLLAHPGFEAATGLPNPFKGGFGVAEVPGTPAGDYGVALNSAVKEAFIPAFESLKGAGAITEAEGQAALKSLANFGTGMSEAQAKSEIQRYVNKIGQGLDIARKQAGMGSSPFTYEDLVRERARRRGGAK